ncbi:hypothetical protein CHELA20_53954 [Hyphomicrobiales bacterium]|nr:hypothetical protein CHELA41_20973 [Hyphomicrobiales bacterium]CAH1685296.1 hypothetical protein CHELA20_53954 [Hyphomicrobiales bacterium]
MSHVHAEQFLLDDAPSLAEAEPARRHRPNRSLRTIRRTGIALATCVGSIVSLYHPAKAQTFEETAVFILSMAGWDRMQDVAAGIVLKDNDMDVRATFDKQTCSATLDMQVRRSIYGPENQTVVTVNFGRVNPASIVRKPFRLPAQTRYETDAYFISFVMSSGDGQRLCERMTIVEGKEIPPIPGRAIECDSTVEFRAKPDKAPRMEAALNHLFTNYCTGMRRAF